MSLASNTLTAQPKEKKKLPPLMPSPSRKVVPLLRASPHIAMQVVPAAPRFLQSSPVTPSVKKDLKNGKEEEEFAYNIKFYIAQLPTTRILAEDALTVKRELIKQKQLITNQVRDYFANKLALHVRSVELKAGDNDWLPIGAIVTVYNKMSEAKAVIDQGNHCLNNKKIAVSLMGQKWGTANPAVPGIPSCTPRTWEKARPSLCSPVVNKPSAVTELQSAVIAGADQSRALKRVKQIIGWPQPGLATLRDYVNAKDGLGWTALMKAASMGREKIIAHLLDAGADRNIVVGSARMTEKPRTAYGIAVQGGHPDSCQTGSVIPPLKALQPCWFFEQAAGASDSKLAKFGQIFTHELQGRGPTFSKSV